MMSRPKLAASPSNHHDQPTRPDRTGKMAKSSVVTEYSPSTGVARSKLTTYEKPRRILLGGGIEPGGASGPGDAPGAERFPLNHKTRHGSGYRVCPVGRDSLKVIYIARNGVQWLVQVEVKWLGT